MSMNYIQDPQSVKIGGQTISKVMSFQFSETAPLSPLASDSDKFTRAVAVGPATITSSVTAQAVSALSLVAGQDLTTGVTVTFRIPQGSTAKITIANGVFGGRSGSANKGNAGSFTYNVQHYSTSGSTSPITYTGT
jgi:hypothetical protein